MLPRTLLLRIVTELCNPKWSAELFSEKPLMNPGTMLQAQQVEQLTLTPRHRVGIVLPTYNRVAFLAEAVASVRRQTFKDWELLICDDASTDSTLQLAQSLSESDPRIQLLSTDSNLGMVRNWQRGVEANCHEYTAFLHDDDVWEEQFLEKTVQVLDTLPGAAFVSTDHWIIDSRGRRLYAETIACTERFGRHKLPEGIVANPLLKTLEDQPFHIITTLFRTHVLQDVGYFRTAAGTVLDFDLFVRLAHEGYTPYFLPQRLVSYRVHNNQHTAKGRLQMSLASISLFRMYSFATPQLESVRQRKLSDAVYSAGASHLHLGNPLAARHYLTEALLTPEHRLRATIGLVVSFLPNSLARKALTTYNKIARAE